MRVRAVAPGRVNLIGEHTDHAGGLVLPMAIDRHTVVEGQRVGRRVRLRSADDSAEAVVPLDVADPAEVDPPWARYVAGVVAELRPAVGFDGTVTTTVPIGSGLSSSAALVAATALALGAPASTLGERVGLARRLQAAEQRASGVPCGPMDQLASLCGAAGCALLVDCGPLSVTPVVLPEGLDVVIVDTGERRRLASSAYAERRAEVAAAEAAIGPLRDATLDDVATIGDPVVRRRAHHVVSENARVRAFARALAAGDSDAIGPIVDEAHASLRDDFEASTPVVDAVVERVRAVPGVLGARLTGGGWGGCVVAFARRGTRVPGGWVARPAAGAAVTP